MNVDHEQARASVLDGLDTFTTCAQALSDLDLMTASRCTGCTSEPDGSAPVPSKAK